MTSADFYRLIKRPMTPADLDRLIKLCGMLGSSAEGERANAGKLASELLSRLGLTWGDVLQLPVRVASVRPPPRPPRDRGFDSFEDPVSDADMRAFWRNVGPQPRHRRNPFAK